MRIDSTDRNKIKIAIAELRKTRKNMFSEQSIENMKRRLKEKTNPSSDVVELQGRKLLRKTVLKNQDGGYVTESLYTAKSKGVEDITIPFNQKSVKTLYVAEGEPISREISLNNDFLNVTESSVEFSKYPNGTSAVINKKTDGPITTIRSSAKGQPTVVIKTQAVDLPEDGMIAKVKKTLKYAHLNKSPFRKVETFAKKYVINGEEFEKVLSKEVVIKKPSQGGIVSYKMIYLGHDSRMLALRNQEGNSKFYSTADSIESAMRTIDENIKNELLV